ncbi:glycosyltransferase [Phaeobacter sp. HF9A]|nr:glycosyltransferase [Phaeobacter sp. HF9A]
MPVPGDTLRPLWSPAQRWRNRALSLLWLLSVVYFWAWWLRPAHAEAGAQYWVASLALAWLLFLQAFFMVIFPRARIPAAAPPDPQHMRVAMIVTKTPSEPLSVLIPTLQAMLRQSYPHDTWLADEAPDEATRKWCAAHGVQISTRQNQPEYHRKSWPRRTRCKEGNLAFFYDHFGYDHYDVVSQLDADHVPGPDYLQEIMRGFADPKVGYVSAPSICARNAGQSWAARSRLYTEAVFHGVFQAGYAATLTPMCIGSHYAVRTRALRSVGGLGPELAEDHSTTLLMNAGGWRGVHAFNAIAYGDGPANIADLCTQEFQWSRSLVTLLLQYTPAYLARLPLRLKFLFLFCQMLYPLIAGFMLLFYLMPIAALLFDIRYANVTFPAFIGHLLPQGIALTALIYMIRSDGYMRPAEARVIAWEKALFLVLQWPWVLWGCLMAVRDRLAGGFVDFRITPKGEAAKASLPGRILAVYGALALGCLLPVLLVDDLQNAQGFYILCAINGLLYAIVVAVTVVDHYRHTAPAAASLTLSDAGKLALPGLLACILLFAIGHRGLESSYALSLGLDPYALFKEQYAVAGAGMGGAGKTILLFDPHWNEQQSSRPLED